MTTAWLLAASLPSCGSEDGCSEGLVDCGGTCVALDRDSAHCGACDAACDAGMLCDGAGICALSCQTGLSDCGGTCVDLARDSANCGACDAACASGELCDGAGTCAVSCQAGLTECDGACVDVARDNAHCGACNQPCPAGNVCGGAGTCAFICPPGLVDCGGSCVDPNTDEAFCGASGDCQGANAGTICAAGERCDGAGACALSCQQSMLDCAGTCVDPTADSTHCGASADCAGVNAGEVCGLGEICAAAQCGPYLDWDPEILVENNAEHASDPQVAGDASGNAIAVWAQDFVGTLEIWTSRYDAATATWGTAEVLHFAGAGAPSASPQIVMNVAGDAFAVWQEHDGIRNNIWSARFDAGTTTWGTFQVIETNDVGGAEIAQIAIDASGNAIAVWRQIDGSFNSIWANRYDAATPGWGTAQLIETDDTAAADKAQVAMDPSGNAVAVWEQSGSIWANRYDAATPGWGTAQLIETDAGVATAAQVAMDGSGSAVAAWVQSDGTRDNIWANRYDAGTMSWGTAQLIETDDAGIAFSPQVAVDTSGNAVSVWHQSDGTRTNIWANHYDAGTATWGAAQLVETDDAGAAGAPQVVVDADGHALAAWPQDDGVRNNLYANRFNRATATWGTVELIEADDLGQVEVPQLTIDALDRVIVVWVHFGSPYANIMAVRLD